MKLTISLIFLSILLSACSSKELYDHTQRQVEINCNNKVGAEKEQCLENINRKPYKEYEAEREAIINNK